MSVKSFVKNRTTDLLGSFQRGSLETTRQTVEDKAFGQQSREKFAGRKSERKSAAEGARETREQHKAVSFLVKSGLRKDLAKRLISTGAGDSSVQRVTDLGLSSARAIQVFDAIAARAHIPTYNTFADISALVVHPDVDTGRALASRRLATLVSMVGTQQPSLANVLHLLGSTLIARTTVNRDDPEEPFAQVSHLERPAEKSAMLGEKKSRIKDRAMRPLEHAGQIFGMKKQGARANWSNTKQWADNRAHDVRSFGASAAGLLAAGLRPVVATTATVTAGPVLLGLAAGATAVASPFLLGLMLKDGFMGGPGMVARTKDLFQFDPDKGSKDDLAPVATPVSQKRKRTSDDEGSPVERSGQNGKRPRLDADEPGGNQ